MSAAHTQTHTYLYTKQTVHIHILTLLIQQDIVWLDISKGDNNRHTYQKISAI